MILWTDEHDELLDKLCASPEKPSAPMIAAAISKAFNIVPPLTRGAVVGRARRRNIKLPRPYTGRERRELRPTPQHNASIYPRTRIVYEERRIRQEARGKILPEPDDAPGIYLLNAADGDCRWPVNEEDLPRGQRHLLRVCGAPVVDKSKYCADCQKRVFDPEGFGGGEFVLPTKQRGLK